MQTKASIMGNMTANLSKEEFFCNCNACKNESADFLLVTALQDACDYFKITSKAHAVKIEITGPNRCPKHNKSIGGARDSRHTYSDAADHKIFLKFDDDWEQVSSDLIANYYERRYPKKYGIGRYENRVHLDTRMFEEARWDDRETKISD